MSVEICIICDDCGAIGGGGQTAFEVRVELARDAEWVQRRRFTAGPGSKKKLVDLCAGCAERETRRQAQNRVVERRLAARNA